MNLIMLFSSIMFGVLFIFLSFIFAIFLISRFFKKEDHHFEPSVSVVIPAYNEEKNIEACLLSIFNSNYKKNKLDVIVVDDGSTDNTLNTLKKYKNVKVIKQQHLGKVEALNRGIVASSNEFILTIDADTSVDKNCIREMLKPFLDKKVGATTGNNIVKNKKSLISTFQNVEYHLVNLMRNSFSIVFNNAAWIAGSLACYRKSALRKINYLKKDTMAEDIDVALELRSSGYKTIVVQTAFGYTIVPHRFKELYRQRLRWWMGTSQAILKNKGLLSKEVNFSILFLYISHLWWSFYAFVSLPLIIYQVYYWIPYNTQSVMSILGYFFRWFSLMGPVYVVYKIPDFGISMYSIFGVLSGLMTTLISVASLKMFKDRINLKNIFGIFFYFPYTIVLNIVILIGLLRHRFWIKSFFIE